MRRPRKPAWFKLLANSDRALVSGATCVMVLLVCFMRSPTVTIALYPITVDSWIQQQELTGADGARGDVFGYSVAVSGNTAIIGAAYKNSYQGAAYIFNSLAAAITGAPTPPPTPSVPLSPPPS